MSLLRHKADIATVLNDVPFGDKADMTRTSLKGKVEGGKITEYRVTLEVTFILE